MSDKRTKKIAVVGVPETDHFGKDLQNLATELGRQVAMHNAITVTGAGAGFAMWTASGAQDAGGTVVGFSPAASAKEHKNIYRLPDEHIDMPIYTGFGHAGRDLLMVRSSDAVIFGPGKFTTLNVFTVALSEERVIGVLSDQIPDDVPRDVREQIVAKADPKNLIELILEKL